MTDRAPLAGLRPAAPPTELRARVLEAAAQAHANAIVSNRWFDRVWESRPLRVAWSLTLLASLLGYLGAEKAAESTAIRNGWIEIVSVSESLGEARRLTEVLP